MTESQNVSPLDLLVAITRVEGKVDSALAQLKDHETRLRLQEQGGGGAAVWKGVGVAAAVLLSVLGIPVADSLLQ